jgi:hypothetical protein
MAQGFHPGGHKGKLHRELGIPVGQTIPHARLEAAMHSHNAEIRRDAIRANTMEHWSHTGPRSGHEKALTRAAISHHK